MSKSSFSAFTIQNEVDESVAKPVLGSDGAARWQDFKGNNKLPTANKFSVAPAIPLKKLDRVALKTTSIRDEQANEAKIRKDAGDRELGAGYTVFKRTSDHDEIAEKKRKKLVLDRVRPDDVPYFIQAETFEGYKFDYVFTTMESRGTGYYWDGMDSLKKELGLPPTVEGANNGDGGSIATETTTKKPKKKKKKRKAHEEPIFESDEMNPMEQIQQAILRRKQAMGALPSSLTGVTNNTNAADAAALGADSRALDLAAPPSTAQIILEQELVAAGWESAKDPSSGKTYYFKRSTNERSWKKPVLLPMSFAGGEEHLPDGWKSTKDESSGKTYYYHTSGKTSWEKPTS